MDAAHRRQAGPPPRELDDLTLARAQRGEPAALRALVEGYQQRVVDLLWRLLDPRGRAAAVDDLAQETFVRVLGALANFDPRGPARLSTWILTIATRLALNELRRTKPLVDLPAGLVAPGAPTDAEAERGQLAAALRQALAAIPDDQRAALLLFEIHGLEYEAIARAVGVPMGTVRSRIARARAALRAQLEGFT